MHRERLALASLLLMESLALFLLATLLARAAGGGGPLWPTVALALLGGFGLVRLLTRLEAGRGALVAVGAGATLLALLTLLNLQYGAGRNPLGLGWLTGFSASPDAWLSTRWPQTWGAIVIAVAWFRGIWLAQRDLSYGLVFASFSAGIGLVIVALLFGQGTGAAGAINGAALPYFLSGLLALALLRLRRAGPDSDDLRGPWLPILLGTIGVLALLSIVIGLFPLDLLNRALAPVGILALRLLDLVIYAITVPIGYVVSWILVHLVGVDGAEWPAPRQAATDAAEQVEEGGERSGFARFFLLLLRFAWTLALLALAAYVLYRVFRRLRRPARTGAEVRESVYREGALGDDLRSLFGNLLGRFRRGERAREPELPAGVLRVRRLYLGMLDRAAAGGVERPPPATPGEFSPTLRGHFRSETPAELSRRFAAARYGRVEPDAAELEALERAARTLQHEQDAAGRS